MIEPNKNCSKCKRLKNFRDSNIKKYPNWFNGAVPSIINKNSEILIVGLAPGLNGANKTGKDRAVNNGGAHIVEPGDKALDDMISTIDKGVLLSRFSGGSPSDNGDFSGVAKNSYYIENGEIKYPITETMISGNIFQMLHEIKDISKETINDGSSIIK